ncbi:MAG: PhoH family protein [Chthoniobacterales bacterium]|nr:PhoH family protein [Chthoniobacterales bacterium]MCX7712784.1 PhoH family protein [Chthoniobacterales bacterium]
MENHETLIFELENARALQALFDGDESLLKEAASQLGVTIITRDAWIKAEGPPEKVEKTRHFLQQLDNARRGGLRIRRHEFLYALRALLAGDNFELAQFLDTKIFCSRNKPPVSPKTVGQQRYVATIRSNDITFGIGPAGTGKTYLAVALAIEALRQDRIRRIILARPAVEAGEALGFLPGDLTEKILPYLRPLHDAFSELLDSDEFQKFTEKNIIEIAPLAYMRGRTLSSAFVILDEAQNATTEQMLMFLTRLGPDSKAVITGDPSQIDLPRHKQSGLLEAIEALAEIPGIAFHYFSDADVVRHPLVQSIIRAYQTHRGRKNFS